MTKLIELLPEAWRKLLPEARIAPLLAGIDAALAAESGAVYPPSELRFEALRLVPPSAVRVVVLGQDPYHEKGQAHGLAFSVPDGTALPPSLKNIFRELTDDVGCPAPSSGCLRHWAEQGVLLLNTVLSVREHAANSHRAFGWLEFTDLCVRAAAGMPQPKVFILWGAPAQKKRGLIDESRDLVIASAHPSPLSAYRGFFGSRPFSQTNAFFAGRGLAGIDWKLESRDLML